MSGERRKLLYYLSSEVVVVFYIDEVNLVLCVVLVKSRKFIGFTGC